MARASALKYIAGRVSCRPSLKPLAAKNRASAGAPHAIALRKASASGTISGATPATASSQAPPRRTPSSSSVPSASASHSDWRYSAPTSSRRPAPSSCATDGGTDSITPITIRITSTQTW